jgi:hypothetical protein
MTNKLSQLTVIIICIIIERYLSYISSKMKQLNKKLRNNLKRCNLPNAQEFYGYIILVSNFY